MFLPAGLPNSGPSQKKIRLRRAEKGFSAVVEAPGPLPETPLLTSTPVGSAEGVAFPGARRRRASVGASVRRASQPQRLAPSLLAPIRSGISANGPTTDVHSSVYCTQVAGKIYSFRTS